MKLRRPILLKATLVVVIYSLLDLLSELPSVHMPFPMEAIWLPSGFLFAMLMLTPKRQWAYLLIPAALAGFAVNLSQQWTIAPAIGFALTDPLEVLLGAWVAHSLLKGRPLDLSRIPDALILGLAGVINGLVAGPAGLLASHLSGVVIQAQYTGPIWSISVLLSHLLIAPLILAWPAPGPKRSSLFAESILWMAVSAMAIRWGLHQHSPDAMAGLLMFLPFPLLVGAALRTGPWGASLALTMVSITALIEGAHGHGPLPVSLYTPDLIMIWLQLFLGTEAASILVLASASDAQKHTEGSLLESESRYRNLVEQFPDGIILREGARIRYANPAAVVLFGAATREDLEGRSMREFLSRKESSSGEISQTGIHRYTASLKDRDLLTLDGRSIPVELTDISISMAGQRPVILDVFRDLSKRREAEDALRRSEEAFERLFDLAPVAMSLSTPEDARLVRANALAMTLFEVDSEDLSTIRSTDFYAREEAREQLLRTVNETGRADGLEVDIITHKGRFRRVLISAALVPYGGKEVLLAGFMDVTLRMKTAEALREAQKLESLGLMAGGVAHDFNNLLTALIGNLDLARMAQERASPADRHFDAMSATLRRASDLSRQMLAYAGQARVEILPVDLNRSVRELTGLMSASMSKKITLHFDLKDDVPLVEADPVQLQQILLNLVTNSADAIGDAEGTITLSTRIEEEPEARVQAESTFQSPGSPTGPWVVLEVKDTGTGMSPEVRARIFDPFFTTKASGHGLGLSTMLGILKAHNGSVSVDSDPGRGSCFTIRFPMPRSLSQPKEASITGSFLVQALEGLVLVVDDEVSIRSTAGAQFKMMGFEVAESGDGLEAVEAVKRHGTRLKLVLLDLSMPRMGGAEALAIIRESHPDLPVILSSGFDPTQEAPELLKQPKTWFLPKPYRLSELRRMVTEVLND